MASTLLPAAGNSAMFDSSLSVGGIEIVANRLMIVATALAERS
jgi:hypothetical protein